MLAPHAPELAQKAVSLAMEGDTVALRLCMERVLPQLRPTSSIPNTVIGHQEMSLGQKANAIVDSVLQGKLETKAANGMLASIADCR